LVNSGN